MPPIIRNFRKTWGYLGAVVAIFFLPQQIRDVPESASLWERVWAMVDRTVALVALVIGIGLWLLYTELRPFLGAMIRSRSPIAIGDDLYLQCSPVAEADGKRVPNVYCVVVILAVTNSAHDKRTLRRVAATFSMIGTPVRLPLHGRKDKLTDIRHGEVALFQIGRFLYGNPVGGCTAPNHIPDDLDRSEIEHNLPNGHLVFRAGEGTQEETANLGFIAGMETEELPFFVTVSADDTASKTLKIRMNLHALSELDKAFKVEKMN